MSEEGKIINWRLTEVVVVDNAKRMPLFNTRQFMP